ncbi:MAG TPA: hypothetical protein VIJ51_13070 [Solirubrobacteraceae bacterium]
MTDEVAALPSCNEIIPRYCATHSKQIDSACHDLEWPAGHKILFSLDGRICTCVCGEGDEARATVSELREQVGRWLGIGRPVSREVLVATLADPAYRRRMAFARRTPEALEWLLARPPALPASAARMVGDGLDQETLADDPEDLLDQSTSALVKRAGGSLMRFVAGGFATVDDETRERRWAACRACPHLADAPQAGVHRLTRVVRPEAKVCGLCGCLAAAKVRAAHEHCPGQDPADPARTRWGEPRHTVPVPVDDRATEVTRRAGFEHRAELAGAGLPD